MMEIKLNVVVKYFSWTYNCCFIGQGVTRPAGGDCGTNRPGLNISTFYRPTSNKVTDLSYFQQSTLFSTNFTTKRCSDLSYKF